MTGCFVVVDGWQVEIGLAGNEKCDLCGGVIGCYNASVRYGVKEGY